MTEAQSMYVLGFMFDPSMKLVAVIRKNKPAWQKGLWNGIGGEIEQYETSAEAMVREFREETGVDTDQSVWTHFATMSGVEGETPAKQTTWSVDCFWMKAPYVVSVRTMKQPNGTQEQVMVAPVQKILEDNQGKGQMFVENLPWLVALAIDNSRDGRPYFADIRYTINTQPVSR
jgi:8-oxo-dGTP diphosphatase